jgi:hypothetical protein
VITNIFTTSIVNFMDDKASVISSALLLCHQFLIVWIFLNRGLLCCDVV